MTNIEMKIKLWAISGIMQNLLYHNVDLGLSQEELNGVAKKSIETYKPILEKHDVLENTVSDSRMLLKILVNDVLNND